MLELKKLGKRGLVRVVGEHPEDKEPIEVYVGKFGPYVKHDGINASIPKDVPVEDVTVEQAVTWLAERKANPPKKRGRKK